MESAFPSSRDSSLHPLASSQWFAVWTRSRHEQVVREQLERKNFDAFLPTITRWSRWKDRKKKIDWPLFRPLRPRRYAANPEMYRGRQHRLVRGETCADSRIRARKHPSAGVQRTAVRSVSDDPRGHDGGSRIRPAAWRRRPVDAGGCAARAARAVGGPDRPGGLSRGRRGRRQGVLNLMKIGAVELASPFAIAP